MVCHGLQAGTPAISYKLITTLFSTQKRAHGVYILYPASYQTSGYEKTA